MKGCRLQRLRPTLTQPFQVPLRCAHLGIAQLRFFCNQPARLAHVARHEDAKRDLQAFDYTFVKRRQFGSALARKLELAFDFLGSDLAQVLVDDMPICSRLITNEMISVARRPSFSSRLPRVSLVT